MNNKLLLQKYSNLEKTLHPIVEFLEAKKSSREYRGIYKGITTLLGPLVYKPEILFMGINPGAGAYIEENIDNPSKNITPLRMIGKDESCLNELDWFKKGNARAGIVNGDWHAYEWYQRDKKTNNSFPKMMIDLLYEIARLKYPQEYKDKGYNNDYKPFWYENFGQKIMYTNLYPIATRDTDYLNTILNSLAGKPEFEGYWGDVESPNNLDVRMFFVKIIEELVALVQPKLIVCMGKSAFEDFTYKSYSGKKKLYKRTKLNIPVIGFSRQGNWSGLLTELAKMIVKEIK
jgi:hypothetical protein